MDHPTKGKCVGKANGLNECSGYCASTYNVGPPNMKSVAKCTCCKPSAYEDIPLIYDCDKAPHLVTIRNPKACDCSACTNV